MAEKAGTTDSRGRWTPSQGVPAPRIRTFAPQLIWLALTFGLLYLLLKRVVLPRVGEVIDERSDRIKRDLAQAEKVRADTQQALANYEQALSEARAKAGAIAKAMRDRMTAEIDKERAKVDAQIAASSPRPRTASPRPSPGRWPASAISPARWPAPSSPG